MQEFVTPGGIVEEAPPSSPEVVRVFAALSDENRFRIVELLAESQEELCCGEIASRLGLSRSLLSHHLATLESAGLLERRKQGLRMMNGLCRPVLATHLQALRSLLDGARRHDAVIDTPAAD